MEEKMKNAREQLLETAENNFSAWNRSLQAKDPHETARLYFEDASFLPTLSPEFKKGREGTEAYFKHFLEKNPSGKIIEQEVQPLGKDQYLHSGLYDFEVGPAEKREVVEARFTFVWKKDESGGWMIIHHHSSLKPR